MMIAAPPPATIFKHLINAPGAELSLTVWNWSGSNNYGRGVVAVPPPATLRT
jgi:hypothetical protein